MGLGSPKITEGLRRNKKHVGVVQRPPISTPAVYRVAGAPVRLGEN